MERVSATNATTRTLIPGAMNQSRRPIGYVMVDVDTAILPDRIPIQPTFQAGIVGAVLRKIESAALMIKQPGIGEIRLRFSGQLRKFTIQSVVELGLNRAGRIGKIVDTAQMIFSVIVRRCPSQEPLVKILFKYDASAGAMLQDGIAIPHIELSGLYSAVHPFDNPNHPAETVIA